MKTGRRFYLRGLMRLPYKIRVIVRYFLHRIKYRGYRLTSIETIRNRHAGETIYIIGSGPSLSSYPDNFVDDKKSMTLHLAYLKFPSPTYTHFTEGDRIPPLIEKDPNFFRAQSLLCNPLFPLDHPAYRIEGATNMEKEPLYIKYTPRRLHFKNIEKQLDAALSGTDIKFQTNSTCLHTGIWCAIILGFREIRLVGCDHGAGPSDSADSGHYFAPANIGDTRRRSETFIQDGYNRMRVFNDEIIRIAASKGITITQLTSHDHYKNLEAA